LVLIVLVIGDTYRKRIDDWLVSAGCVPAHAVEFASYHAIVATVAAGTGIAVIPRSVIQVLSVESQVALHLLPRHVADAKTQLVWCRGHQSLALAALHRVIPRPVTEYRPRSAAKIA
jgi:DNA-binding transcriptional LysR family regulator